MRIRRSPIDNSRALYGVASAQGGYFTSLQALGAGYSYPQQTDRVRKGVWERIDWGIYRLRDFPRGPHEDLIRWTLWSRDRRGVTPAVISHETALSVHELSDLMPPVVHLTVPPAFRRRSVPGSVLHRAVLEPSAVEERHGFRITTPLRTLLDVAGSPTSQGDLNAAVSDALRAGLIDREELDRASVADRARGRIRIALDAAAVERRVPG